MVFGVAYVFFLLAEPLAAFGGTRHAEAVAL